MKTTSLLLGCAMLLGAVQVNATVHRVNNNAGASAAFNNFNTAVASASVLNGDTLYLEPSATAYTPTQLNKRLVIIGPGYFLDPANVSFPGNTGLQANVNGARFASALAFDTLATGSRFLGVELGTLWLDPRADNITFERCYIVSGISWNTNATAGQQAVGIRFNKCFISAGFSYSTFNFVDLEITNCIFTTGLNTSSANVLSALIRNNLFTSSVVIQNAYFANNILINVGGPGFNATNCVVRHNISQFANVFPAGNGNQSAPANDVTRIILNTGTVDGRYRLSPSSIAIGAGETVGGVTPDVGPFGTADPYRLSGIPPIPSIYSLTTPATVPAAATTMNITLSTRSNN
ncbi:MAG: hypothetical protein MUF62_03900 [Chitinophagaceae bacterium]|nr:hypothetical protein [Chitinophagaceae bacterium]